ncbi:hypothetical protein pb186bvf_000821 [Paramecium bursaria]
MKNIFQYTFQKKGLNLNNIFIYISWMIFIISHASLLIQYLINVQMDQALDYIQHYQKMSQSTSEEFPQSPTRSSCFIGTQTKEFYQVVRKYVNSQTHGVQLYYQEFIPTQVQGQILIVHGFGEHSDNYKHIAEAFVQNNYKACLYDQRGFGYSGGRRGSATVDEMHQDLQTILLNLDRSIPIFIYCHALGAGLVLSFCLVNPEIQLQGIITSSALLRMPSKYGRLKMLILRILNQLCPELQVNTYLNLSFASKNNFHMKKIATDPLIWPYMSIQFAYNILLFQQYILPNAHKFKIPILLLHGKENKVASHLDSIDFYRHAQSKDKTIKIYESGFHELHNDSEWPKMKIFMLQWCQKQLGKDFKVSFMRELNHGISQKKTHNILRIIGWLIFLIFKNKLPCLRMIYKIGLLGAWECAIKLLK